MHTTNYTNTFIEIAPDSPTSVAQIPPDKKESKTIAKREFELISKNPYRFTSDEVKFRVFAEKNEILKSEYEAEKEKFFSKGQPCFRASALTKRYGWGVHADEAGKIALVAAETDEYNNFLQNEEVKKVKAMKTKS